MKKSLAILLFVFLLQLVASQTTTYTGYLIDIFCWDRPGRIAIDGANLELNPAAHSVHCMRDIPQCINGGYGLLEKVGNKYQLKYRLDSVGNANVLQILKTTKTIDNFVVTATGVDNRNGTLVGATFVESSQTTFTGYLIDIFCWERPGRIAIDGANLELNPAAHSVHCMRDIPQCINGGYGLLEKVGSKYQLKYKLDSVGNANILQILKTTKTIDNFVVVATGMDDRNGTLVGATFVESTQTTFTGYLIDIFCWERPGRIAIDGANLELNPAAHSVHCMRDIPQCINGGYGLLEKIGNKYQLKYKLDSVGNANILQILKTTKTIDNFVVVATGMDNRNGTLVGATFVEFTNGTNPDNGNKPSNTTGNSITALDILTLKWKVDTTLQTIEFNVFGKDVKGWIAVGFNVNKEKSGMNDLDLYMGYVSNGALVVEDKYVDGLRPPETDVSQGGKNDIIQSSGGLTPNGLSFTFSRKLDTGDSKFDRKIVVGEPLNVVFAYHLTSNTPTTYHTGRTIIRNVNLFNGGTPPSQSFVIPIYYQFIVLAVVTLVVTVLGFFFRFCHTKFLISLLFHYPISMLIKTDGFLNRYFFVADLLNQLLNIRGSDFFMLLCYLIILAAWSVTSVFTVLVETNEALPIIARVLGHLNLINFALVFLPVTRNSIWTLILGIPFERAIKYHQLMGRITYINVFLHGLLMFIFTSQRGSPGRIFEAALYGGVIKNGYVFGGFASFVCLTLMILFSLEPVRRFTWEVFHFSHYLFGIPACVFAAIHHWYFACYIGVGLILWAVDIIVRIIYFLTPCTVVDCKALESNGITQITLHKPNFKWKGGQYVFVWIPSVSLFEMHPFSISCGPSGVKIQTDEKKSVTEEGLLGFSKEKYFTLHIKAMNKPFAISPFNTFTKNLYDLALSKKFTKGSLIRVEGGYGELSVPYESYEVACLVCGGIGVTPMLSLMMEISDKIDRLMNLKKVYFMWTVQDKSNVEPFFNILDSIIRTSEKFEFIINVSRGAMDDSKERFVYKKGRANYDELFDTISSKNSSANKFAVYVCGPKEMVKTIHNTCYVRSLKSKKQFHLHRESFEF